MRMRVRFVYPHMNRMQAVTDTYSHVDGVIAPDRARSRSQSRVRFNLDANTARSISPETLRKQEEASTTSSETNEERKHRRRRRNHDKTNDERHRSSGGHDNYERQPQEEDSDGTVELPPRFDEQGNRKPDADPLTDGLSRLLGGGGLGNLLGGLMGGDDRDEDSGRSGRRRHRRS